MVSHSLGWTLVENHESPDVNPIDRDGVNYNYNYCN